MQSYPITKKYLGILLLVLGISISIKAQTLVISEITNNTSESGDFIEFTIGTEAVPDHDFTVTIVSLDDTELTVSPASVNFVTGTSSTHTITVTGIDDTVADGDIDANIDLRIDGISQNLVTVTNTDDETADFTLTPTSTNFTEGQTDQLSVILSSQPVSGQEVIIDFNSSDANAASLSTSSLTFNSSNWNITQNITITGVSDNDAYDESATITASVNASSTSIPFLDIVKTVDYTITDDETADFNLSATSLIINEGSSVAFSIALATQPANDVVINLASDNTNAAAVSPASITFTSNNWSTSQIITVNGVQDNNVTNESATVAASVDPTSDAGFTGLTDKVVTITVNDDDVANFTVSPNPLGISEGSTGTFSVVLTAQPSSEVVINLSNDNTDATSFVMDPLSFTTENWNTPQAITVTGLTDADPYNASATVTLTVDNTNSDSDFHDLTKTLTINVTDNQTPDFVLSTQVLSVDENSSGSLTVTLNSQPTNPVTINLTSDDTDIATVSPASITFTNSDWNDLKTITISGVDDADLLNEATIITAAVAVGSDAGFTSIANKTINITVSDDDIADFSLSNTSLSIDENSTEDFTVVLNAQPSSDVVINLVSSDNGAATLSLGSLTFTESNWANPQTVTISAINDNDVINETVTITASVDNANSDDQFDNLIKTLTANVTDDDIADFELSSTALIITEGTQVAFTVWLAAQPIDPVTINLSSNNTAAATTTPNSLTFTASNWNTAQTVTITALNDNNLTDESATITATVSDGSDASFINLDNKEISITVTDNDIADYTVSPSPLSLTEGGTGSFSVVLSAQPTNDVVINLSNDNTAAASFDLTPLTFKTENWSTAQQIVVTGLEDDDAVDETAIVTLSIDGSSDPDFIISDKTLTINVSDNESANFVLSASEINITEGNSANFTVVLTAAPTNSVTIDLGSNNTEALSLSNNQIVFDNSNWNQAQTISITALEDDNVINESVTITASVGSGSDSGYSGLQDKTITVIITENDTPDFSVTPTSLEINETSSQSFSVVLLAEPSSDVVIQLTSSDEGAATVDESTLTFTTDNWATPQTITVNAINDADSNNESVNISVIVDNDNSDTDFNDISKTVSVIINDDDSAGFTLSESEINVDEGTSGTFNIVLTAEPVNPVTITLTSSNSNSGSISPSSVTFNSGNWNQTQTATIAGLEDNNVIDEVLTITASVESGSDASFINLDDQQVNVTITDNDSPDFLISTTSLTIPEGSTSSFTVTLAAQPTNNVIINIATADANAASVSQNSLTFTNANWNTAQTVIVGGVTDSDSNDETVSVTLSVNASSDADFTTIDDKVVTVNIEDDDVSDLTIIPSPLSVTEGSTSSFSITLTAQPVSPVIINLVSDDTNIASLSTASITFSTANWNIPQQIVVSGVQDDDINNETTSISISVTNAGSAASYHNISKTLTVNVIEDDTAPVFTSTPITTINEDEIYSYNIITSDADGDIASLAAIQIPSWLGFTDNGDGTALLTGTPLNEHVENSPYSITIRATDRFTTVDHSFSITVANTNDAPVFSSTGITQATEDSPYLYNITVTDDDNDNLTISATTLPSWINFSSVTNGQAQLSGTPTNNEVGTHAVSLRAFDGTTATFQNFEITVSNVNDAPVITSTHLTTATEDTEYNYTVTTRDDDGDIVNISASTLPAWLTISDNGDGTALITGTPTDKDVKSSPVLLRLNDNTVTRYIGFEILVTNINDAPVINNTTFSTRENTSDTIKILDIAWDDDNNIPGATEDNKEGDIDINSITLGLISSTNGIVEINIQDTIIIYKPYNGFTGSDSFSVIIQDKSGVSSNDGTITIQVSNQAPIAINDQFTINEDSPTTFNVLLNDTDLQNNIDPSSVSLVSTDPPKPSNGSVLINDDGTIRYTPNLNFFGSDNFSYEVSDTDGYKSQANVSITINPVNDAPTLENDAETTAEDSPVTINVLDNDSDIDDAIAPSTLQIVDQPLNGAVNINTVDYTITYTPTSDFNGTDSFSYSVSDESGDSSEASVSITVTPVNDAPTPVDDNVQTQEETPIVIYVLANDTDLENNIDSCSVTVITRPTHGTTLKIGCGRIQYTPNDNFNGDDSFTYQVTDSIGGSGTATVYLTVTTVADSPVAIADSYTTDEDVAVVMDVLLNDYDNDNDINISSLSIASEASNGNLAINNGEITYTPNQDFNGSDSFTYQICDDTELCATATVTITINSVNDAPVAEDDNDSGIGNGSVRTNVASNDYDVEDNLNLNSINIISQPQNGSVQVENGTGYIIYTPETNFDGTDQYSYEICDGEGECAQATVYITITSQDFTPVTTSDYIDLDEDGSVSIYPLDNDSSPNSALDPSTLTIIEGPFNGSYNLNISNSQIVYVPDENYYGKDTIVYQICNEASICAVDTIFIVINSVNDAPAPKDDYITVLEGETIELDVTLNDTDIESPDLIWARIATYTPSIKGTAIMLSDRRTLNYTAPYNCGCSEEVVDYILEDGTGAISGARVHITIEKAPDNIPEVFSPNGDGYDDYFVIPGIGTEEFDNNELFIFNRWGAQIYHMKNYDNSWDGKSSVSSMGSDELPEGTYFYVFKLSSGRVIKGTVYLKK
ncbi:Ig-like domain-containing protein [Carboxylicivirga caseinilyticus]|uniref:Ig-like domain-containing protein n=1 Tax=Carboxylicivirga caseinilyticus TaxID=3417572 RepID=UPI003D33EDB2|nr:tandem-95 repeat protein [Marinilabiliaceae bacterium A049]